MGSSTPPGDSTARSSRHWARHPVRTFTSRPSRPVSQTVRTTEADPGRETAVVDGPDRLGRSLIHVRGHRISVVEHGIHSNGGPRPLLLINGIGATGELFHPFVAAVQLLDDRQLITFDAPGIGHSSTPGYPPTLRQLAALVDELVERLGHDQVDVLGLSWGGTLAQELAYRHPHRIGRLVLTATSHGWTSVPGRPAALSILLSPARYYSTYYLYNTAPTLYGGAIRDNPELLREHAQVRMSRPPTVLGYAWQMAALRRWTSWPWLDSLDHITLVMAGDDDPIIPLANAVAMAGRIPRASLHVVRGGGHLFLYTKPHNMAARILKFLDT